MVMQSKDEKKCEITIQEQEVVKLDRFYLLTAKFMSWMFLLNLLCGIYCPHVHDIMVII